MLIEIINSGAEKKLLYLLEQYDHHDDESSALYFQSSKLKLRPSQEDIFNTINTVLGNSQAAIYFFHDGDVMIIWKNTSNLTPDNLFSLLRARYNFDRSEELDIYFDYKKQREDIKNICKSKIADIRLQEENAKSVDEKFSPLLSKKLLQLTPDKLTPIRNILYKRRQERRHSRKIDILVVEDQVFSSKILVGMLNNLANTYSAENAEAALDIYMANAPDIVFLDIELGGMNGHELASIINKLDSNPYIVMITANNYIEDVMRAKENAVKGFIAKPYNKQKILSIIDNYFQKNKRKSYG
jgi:CheY-like chemotaxis protein